MVIPGAVSFSEWNVRLGNPPRVATCVEVSEMVVDHLVKAGFPLSNAEDVTLATDLINRGQADPDGATNYLAASQQMARLGIPNTPYGADWFAHNAYQFEAMNALRHNIPVLFGFSEAHLSYDDWTQQGYNAGVYGHAIVLVGFDDTGAIVADPNTPQATRDQFVHYSWANLLAAGGAWPSMVIPQTGALQMSWNKQADGTGRDSAGHTCGTGCMAYLASSGLGLSDGRASEVVYDGVGNAFLPLDSGAVIRAQHNADGTWTVDADGALLALALHAVILSQQSQIAAFQAEEAGEVQIVPTDPVAAQCKQVLAALKAILPQLS